VLRYELLSAGTRDLFALALRLAMAELYLDQGSGGGGTPQGTAVAEDTAPPKNAPPAGEPVLAGEPARAEGAAPSGSGGFLVMDDPLVDLDPDRQEAAAAVLGRFASRRQLLLFTCHPAHAALLQDACARDGVPVSRIELSLGQT
jgi:hypothetical protein